MLRCIIILFIVRISLGGVTLEPRERILVQNDNEFVRRYRRHVNGNPLPNYVDWRKEGKVSPVKNQLHCSACWAFGVVAAVESHLAIHAGVREVLSEQFLIDCDPDNIGCSSHHSILDSYSNIVTKLGGILRESDYYPYEDHQSACRWSPRCKNVTSPGCLGKTKGSKNSNAVPVPVIGFTRVKPDEDVMAEVLFKYGPITAAINSASMAKYGTSSAIDEPPDEKCNPNTTDHTVLIVGYSEYVPQSPNKPQVKYWIIKNSWGTAWGDKGFYYLVRGRNACGIATDLSLPFVAV